MPRLSGERVYTGNTEVIRKPPDFLTCTSVHLQSLRLRVRCLVEESGSSAIFKNFATSPI